MRLYLLRHGIAEDAAPTGRDADRELTPKGVHKLKQVFKLAKACRLSPGLIVSSPLIRARQTAKVAAECLGYRGDLIETKALSPGGTARMVWEEVRLHPDIEDLLLVGHEPLFSELYSFFLDSPTLVVNVKKGSLGRIDLNARLAAPRGELRWLLVPPGSIRKEEATGESGTPRTSGSRRPAARPRAVPPRPAQ